MDVAVAEEPQKKIFRARKTMKISDRQQLESLHNTLPSSKAACPSPPLLNGRHPAEGQKESEREKTSAGSSPMGTRSASPASRSPTPLALSLSLSPSPPAKTPEEPATLGTETAPSSPASRAGAAEMERGKGDEGKTPASPSADRGEGKRGEKEEEKEGQVKPSVLPEKEKEKEDDPPKPQGSPKEAPAGSPAAPLPSEGTDEDREKTAETKEAVAMDTGPSNDAPEDTTPILDKMAAAASSLAQSPAPPGNTTTSSPSLSPSHAPESDQEVKEGFLVLSEEEEAQGDKEDEKEKEREEGEDRQDGEKMEVEKGGEKEEGTGTRAQSASPPPPASPVPSPGEGGEVLTRQRKRALTGVVEPGQLPESGEKEQPENQRKRPRVERDELEAHIELKISGNADSRHKLEKVVQQLVAEQLRVLQLSVFDRSLQELRERVEKIDCATKHQHTLDTLQAKITRLTKKFGAANQARENLRKPQEISALSCAPSGSPAQRTARSVLDSQRTMLTTSPAGSTGPPKIFSAPSPSTSSPVAPAAALSLISTSSSASPTTSVTSAPPSTPHKPNAPHSPATPTPSKPMSLQPLLIQLPLAVANAQGGTLLANHGGGMELVPVTSLAGPSPLNKAKAANAAPATFILQKTVPSSAAVPVPSSPSLPQITLARAAVYAGSGGMVTAPGSAVSVTSARTPAQCASAVGATSASSLPTSSTPAATGGQSSGATASAPLSGAAMASKTDTQATSRAPDSTTAKSPAQASRGGRAGAVIDLTEDDDDVLVTGVKKATVQSAPSVSASPSSSSPSSVGQRAAGGPPPLNSHATMHSQPSAQTTVNVSQRCQAVAPSPSRVLPHSSSKSSITLPSSGAVGGVRGAVGVTAAVGCNRLGSPQATGAAVRSSPQSTQHLNGPQLTVHHRPLQESLSKSLPCAALGPAAAGLPPLPSSPAPAGRLPPEAGHTSPPQQPQLKLARVQSQNGIVLSWCVEETDRTCAAVDSYHLYAYHQDQGPAGCPASQWKKIGEVKALPLPMACTLTQFVSGSKYYFAVRARDVYGRFGAFCEPQCTDVITPSSSSASS